MAESGREEQKQRERETETDINGKKRMETDRKSILFVNRFLPDIVFE